MFYYRRYNISNLDIFMKLPVDAIIAREKLTQYLLVPRQKNDKSRFLAQVGFTLQNPEALEEAV